MHTPGHKGKNLGPAGATLGAGIWRLDLSEVASVGESRTPPQAVAAAEALAAEAFGAGRSFFLVNGASQGIQAVTLAWAAGPETIVLLPRDSHRSLVAALVLSGAWPRYLYPVTDSYLGIPLGVPPQRVSEALREGPVNLVWLLRPSYYGSVAPLEAVVGEALALGIRVAVDEAHGAHLAFHPDLPCSALRLGADAVVHGAHKTLAALTQTGFLHLGAGGDCQAETLKAALELLGTTSPSYPLLASLDSARAMAVAEGRERLGRLLPALTQLTQAIDRLGGFYRPGARAPADSWHWDPTRITIAALERGLSGYDLARELRAEGVEVELAEPAAVTLLFSMADTATEVEATTRALQRLAARTRSAPVPSAVEKLLAITRQLPPPLQRLSPREAYLAPGRRLPLEDTRGCICQELVAPYPPGRPLLLPGEEVTGEALCCLEAWRPFGVEVATLRVVA